MSKSGSSSFVYKSPEEKSILTATRVSVKNQKYKKELAATSKGLNNERKHDIVTHKKSEQILKDKLNRLNQEQEKNELKSARKSLRSLDKGPSQSSSLSSDKRNSDIGQENEKSVQFATSLRSEEKLTMLARARSSQTSTMHRESIAFGSADLIKADQQSALKKSSVGSLPRRPSSPGLPPLSPRNSLKTLPSRQQSTRVLNARLKQVRPGGRRHSSLLTLREVMDQNASARKDLAYNPEEFTPEKAWEMLNCNYLRLTPTNIETLEAICEKAGYDISSHPHKQENDITCIFAQLRNEAKHSKGK